MARRAAERLRALHQEADALAALYREQGQPQEAAALMARLALVHEPAEAVPPPDAFEEFPLEPRAAPPPDYMEDFGAVAAPPPSGPLPPPARPMPPAEPEFVAYEELDSLIEGEMQKAGEVSEVSEVPRRPAARPLDEKSLFADEQQFFNLAEELEKELAEEKSPPPLLSSKPTAEPPYMRPHITTVLLVCMAWPTCFAQTNSGSIEAA